ncbi:MULTISPECIES: hypothetical protein [Pseudomonas]|jgi:hypothetical protein|uniref:Uncharacterized protein n=2 Tax=Pseudomonas TaxID=286 RepID=A0A231G0V5_PSEJE|nr:MULTISPECIES: hypothetical protein [Pseudomonas]OXR30151.1 hypothetical protein PSJE_25700 [Pseudomonas jessenii]QHF38887.1 hypothetical protein PspS34_11695 [Pseudomonas sp. S34]SEC20425.1 hypothetical protein SAMN04490187_3540 [Pseudomonas jessenii]VVP51980.1 hypothetical protein PS893_05430 [Pseudomonas fluorescens]VVP70346.1 hypothetical protein PS922_00636 [Pseudomonas fluorescens]
MQWPKGGFEQIRLTFGVFGVVILILLIIIDSYGYRGADIEFMRGRAVHFSGSKVSVITVRDSETGRYKQLDYRLTRAPGLFREAKGKEIELSFINGSLLDCSVDGVKLCSARCSSGGECEELYESRESRKARFLVFMFFSFSAFAHLMLMWKRWKLRNGRGTI